MPLGASAAEANCGHQSRSPDSGDQTGALGARRDTTAAVGGGRCVSFWLQVGNDPTNNRFHCSEASIRSCEELDRSHLHLAHRGGPEVGTGTGPYGDCRSTQCCVAVWSRWLESVTRLRGFRALKKTLEAPYTTKVNNRDRTSRGTTQLYAVLIVSI